MHFVEASSRVVKFPMMLEGVFIGILGGLAPAPLTILGYQYVYTILGGTFMSNMSVLQTILPMTLEISGILILIGVLVGLVGSFFSTTRYLHQKHRCIRCEPVCHNTDNYHKQSVHTDLIQQRVTYEKGNSDFYRIV